MSSIELLLDNPLASGETIEIKLSTEELTPSSYTPTMQGIEIELDVEGPLWRIYYMPVATNIMLDKDVLDISSG